MSVGTFRHKDMQNSELFEMYEEIKLLGKVALADKKLTAGEILYLIPLAMEVVEKAPGSVKGEQKQRLAARLVRDLAAGMRLAGPLATRLNYILSEPYLENMIDMLASAAKGEIKVNDNKMKAEAIELLNDAKRSVAKMNNEAKQAAMGILEEARSSARSIKEANLRDLSGVVAEELGDIKESTIEAKDDLKEIALDIKEKVEKKSRKLRRFLPCL